MKKLVLPLVFSLLLGGCTIKNPLLKKPAGLEVSSTPSTTVFLDGKNVGTTPYSDHNLKPGKYTVKLIPTTSDVTAQPWETQVELIPQVTTIVNRIFATSEVNAEGYVLQLLKVAGDKTYLSVISDPDTVNLTLDGKPQGFTPVTMLEISPGSHQLDLVSPGYKPQQLSVSGENGYNLIVNVKLSPVEITLTPVSTATPSASPDVDSTPSASLVPSPSSSASPSTLPPPYVIIKETGTGWLRIRAEASGTSEELGKVDVGEKLKYLNETTETGWMKVEFEGKPGWLSGKYADLVK
ncbi:MAG: PEGA domain-containing protein [bacterium]